MSVLGGAPYGYSYIKKTDHMPARYEINPTEASVVQEVYRLYSEAFLSIGTITRKLNEEGIPTKKRISKWERSTVWAMLRNPAYIGKACFGKTERAERQRITKPLRAKGGYTARNSSSKEKPREQWIEIPVPAIVDPAVFAIVQERLQENKLRSRRNTKVDTLLQGMMVCSECGCSLYRTATTTSAKNKIYYYRCFGSDAYRFEGERKCTCKPLRQDYLDQVVWDELVRLLEDPELIQREITKRVKATKQASPALHRKATMEKQKKKLEQSMNKLLDAYQEGLIPISQLRKRMPELQKRVKITERELETIKTQELALDERLQLLDVQSFTKQLNRNIHELDIKEKKKILRLLVKEVVVGDDVIDIKHSIPLKEVKNEHNDKSYQLCTRTNYTCFM